MGCGPPIEMNRISKPNIQFNCQNIVKFLTPDPLEQILLLSAYGKLNGGVDLGSACVF